MTNNENETMSTETKEGYTVRDKRGLPDEQKVDEICRCCGAPKVHTQSYNSPTMDCVKYLRFQASGLGDKLEKSESDIVLLLKSLSWLRDTGSFFEASSDNEWMVISQSGSILGKHRHSLTALSRAMQALPGVTP